MSPTLWWAVAAVGCALVLLGTATAAAPGWWRRREPEPLEQMQARAIMYGARVTSVAEDDRGVTVEFQAVSDETFELLTGTTKTAFEVPAPSRFDVEVHYSVPVPPRPSRWQRLRSRAAYIASIFTTP